MPACLVQVCLLFCLMRSTCLSGTHYVLPSTCLSGNHFVLPSTCLSGNHYVPVWCPLQNLPARYHLHLLACLLLYTFSPGDLRRGPCCNHKCLPSAFSMSTCCLHTCLPACCPLRVRLLPSFLSVCLVPSTWLPNL